MHAKVELLGKNKVIILQIIFYALCDRIAELRY